MGTYEFEIEQKAKFTIEAESKESAFETVMHDVGYYLEKYSNECYVSKGEEVKK